MTWNASTLPFLERYADPLPIRSRGAFQILSARRAHDGSPCVLVLPGRSADPRRADEALAEVEAFRKKVEEFQKQLTAGKAKEAAKEAEAQFKLVSAALGDLAKVSLADL